MLTFFRHIRKSLLGSGQARKYILYAIGEIALVVIGILIALQINNWNEERKKRNKEISVLEEISSNLGANMNNIEGLLYGNYGGGNLSGQIQSASILFNHFKSTDPYSDSLGLHFSNALNYGQASFVTSGYNFLVSVGLDILSNKNIRIRIAEFFDNTIDNLNKDQKELYDDFYSYILDYTRMKFEDYTILNDGNVNIRPRDYETLRNDKDFVESLRVFTGLKTSFRNSVLNELDNISSLKKDIDSEISRLTTSR